MIYVFDTSSFVDLFNHYYESRFPSLWELFDDLVVGQRLVSVREVANEIKSYHRDDRLTTWVDSHRELFEQPTYKEMLWVRRMFKNKHFQNIVQEKSLLKGSPVADPFVIARAKVLKGVVVTEERYKDNAARIPNICEHLSVPYTNLEGFMEREEWKF